LKLIFRKKKKFILLNLHRIENVTRDPSDVLLFMLDFTVLQISPRLKCQDLELETKDGGELSLNFGQLSSMSNES